MAEKREWTMVSNLVGDVEFGISGGKPGQEDYIPKTDGFVIRVTYTSETEKMKAALNSTRIAVQNTVRQFYRKNGRFPFKPGVKQAVQGDGEFTLPVTIHMDRLEAQAKAGELDTADRVRLARIAGIDEATIQMLLGEAQGVLDSTNESTSTSQGMEQSSKGIVDSENESMGGISSGEINDFKYSEGELRKLSTTRLKIMAAGEDIDGHDEMRREELIQALMEVEE